MVIQRWQSVFLLIAAVMMGIFTFFSLGQVQLTDYTLNFTTLGFQIEGIPAEGAGTGYMCHTWLFFAVSLLSCILPFINIFLFKDLKLQSRVCLIEILILLAVLACGCAYGYYQFDDAQVSWSSLIVAPLIAFVADIMAYNRISHDMRLLRDSSRLR